MDDADSNWRVELISFFFMETRREARRKIFGGAMPTSVQTPPPKPIESVKVRSHVSTYDQRTGNLQETKGDRSHSQHNRYK